MFVIDELAFQAKVQFILMNAHFAAKHFKTAQNLLSKVCFLLNFF